MKDLILTLICANYLDDDVPNVVSLTLTEDHISAIKKHAEYVRKNELTSVEMPFYEAEWCEAYWDVNTSFGEARQAISDDCEAVEIPAIEIFGNRIRLTGVPKHAANSSRVSSIEVLITELENSEPYTTHDQIVLDQTAATMAM